MKASTDHIATSHVGSLPRPDGLIAAHRAHEAGEPVDEAAFQETLREAVAEVVRRQRDLGIDIPGDGEFGKPMAQRVQYGPGGAIPGGASAGSISRPDRARSMRRHAGRAPARWC